MTSSVADIVRCTQAARSFAEPRGSKQAHGRSVADVSKTILKALCMLLPMPPRTRRFASLSHLRMMAELLAT